MKKWILVILSLVCISGVVSYTSYVRISQNLYEVDPGRFYRSAQLTSGELEDAIRKYGIKTVVSLRGNSPGILGGPPEEQTLSQQKVAFYPFALETDYFPSKSDLNQILEILHTAPKPILIHCKTGADRTGMISAIYALEEMKLPKDKALEQLSFKYWHVRKFHPAMSEFVKIYRGREWAKSEYEPCDYLTYKEHLSECNQTKRSEE